MVATIHGAMAACESESHQNTTTGRNMTSDGNLDFEVLTFVEDI